MRNRTLCILLILISGIAALAEIVERGAVKEYQGKEAKTALPGVELMVKGAQSTVSDRDGNFSLRFATLKPGERVDYTDIYKDGYVIFNKDALDAWRISNTGRPFTIVMCREADFRALKKKFYGIIEKSYQEEYLRQKELAQKFMADAMELDRRLKELEKEYQEKMGNINTYVELFSRIDRNEMDSIEARSLEYMEQGNISEAIRLYEELRLERRMKEQFAKWDAAEEMHRAAQGMESEAQADLIALIDKMQKQISLYTMGGREYYGKRREMKDNLIDLLYRIRPVAGNQYDELLGRTIVEQVADEPGAEQIAAHRKAAALPSIAGLRAYAMDLEMKRPTPEITDSIRSLYLAALSLNPNDSIAGLIHKSLLLTPEGHYRHTDGNLYAYRLESDGTAVLTGEGAYYSTPLQGDVKLPDAIMVRDTMRTVSAIGEFAFGSNPRLRRVIMPRDCRRLEKDAFKNCDSITVVLNANLDSIANTYYTPNSLSFEYAIEIPSPPRNTDWIWRAINYMESKIDQDSQLFNGTLPQNIKLQEENLARLREALVNYWSKEGDEGQVIEHCAWLANYFMDNQEYDKALEAINKIKNLDKELYHTWLSSYYYKTKEYDKVIPELKKTGNSAYTYNNIAYRYADPLIGTPDYTMAHKMVDKAISKASSDFEKANFYDTKGELYLKEGKVAEAAEYLQKALAVDSTYQSGNSILYNHFNPVDSIAIAEEKQLQIHRVKERNVAIALMACEYLEDRAKNYPDFPKINFRDLNNQILSYAVNLTEQQQQFGVDTQVFFIYCLNIGTQYIYQQAQKAGLPFDNKWVGLMGIDKFEELDPRFSNLIYNLVGSHEIVNRLPCKEVNDYSGTPKWFVSFSNSYMEQAEEKEKEMLGDIIKGHDTPHFQQQYGVSLDSLTSWVNNRVIPFGNAYTAPDQFMLTNSSLDEDRYTESIRNSIDSIQSAKQKNKDRYSNWIDLIQKIAKIEHRYMPASENFKGVDYEELLSIGIIALDVLLKNRTEQQLQKYNPLYIMTAITWAIRNELNIRYSWYTLDRETTYNQFYNNERLQHKYDELGMDGNQELVRITIYHTLAQLLNYYAEFREPISDEEMSTLNETSGLISTTNPFFRSLNKVIKETKTDLTGDQAEFFDILFGNDPDKIQKMLQSDPNVIHTTLNKIRENLNKYNLYGY